MQKLRDLHVLILGLGASGLAMARWCARHGAVVTVADTRELPPQLASLQAEWPDVRFVSGPFSAALIEGTPVRAVFRSPGLAPEVVAPVAEAARAAGLNDDNFMACERGASFGYNNNLFGAECGARSVAIRRPGKCFYRYQCQSQSAKCLYPKFYSISTFYAGISMGKCKYYR